MCQLALLVLCLVVGCDSLDSEDSGPGGAAGGEVDAGGSGLLDAGMEPDGGADAGGPMPPGGRVVRVDDGGTTVGTGFTECVRHEDCALANDGCALCCEQIAVRKALAGEYEQARAAACEAANRGPAPCDCVPADLVPRCRAGQCAAVRRDAFADTCFSPVRPEGAFEPGGVGCNCTLEDQQICVGGAPLICERLVGSTVLAWVAVEDGPCWPRPDGCPDGTVVADAQECLARFPDCYERDDGSFCGVFAPAGTTRSCQQLQADVGLSLSNLRACDSAADCGQVLMSSGCGCTRAPVGRTDADPTSYEALLEELLERQDEPGCAVGGSTCDCPYADGYVCDGGQCDWDVIAPSELCDVFDGRQYRSVEELECGLGESGPEPCHWTLRFQDGSFEWSYSDVGESGDYSCSGTTIEGDTGNAQYTGEAPGDGTLVWDGVVYERVY